MANNIAKLTTENLRFGLCYGLSFILSFTANKIFITSNSNIASEIWQVYLSIQGISALSASIFPYYIIADRMRYRQLCLAVREARATTICITWLSTCYLVYSINNIIFLIMMLGLLSCASACLSSYWIVNKNVFSFSILGSALPASVLVGALLGSLSGLENSVGLFSASFVSFVFYI